MAEILVIDDSATQAALIAGMLMNRNYRVETATSATKGLEKAVNGNFDLVIVDLNMPEMDGLEICRLYKTSGKVAPIILVTSEDQLMRLEPDQKMGADYYSVKDQKELGFRVDYAILRGKRHRNPQL